MHTTVLLQKELSKYLHIYRAEWVLALYMYEPLCCGIICSTHGPSILHMILALMFAFLSSLFTSWFSLHYFIYLMSTWVNKPIWVARISFFHFATSWILYLNWFSYLLQCSMCINISLLHSALLSFVLQNCVSLTWRVVKKKNMNQKYAWLAEMAIQHRFQWVLIQIWCWEISLR